MRFVATFFLGILLPSGSIFSQTSWVHTNGSAGLCSPFLLSNEKYAFVQYEDFLFRTTNGLQWDKIEHGGVSNFAIYKDTLVQPLYNPATLTVQLQVSTDNGDNWIVKDLPAHINSYFEHESYFVKFDIGMSRQGIFLIQPHEQTPSTLYRSIDFGETWDSVLTPGLVYYHLEISDDKVYVFDDAHIFRLDSDGKHWTQIHQPTIEPCYAPFGGHCMLNFVVKDSNILLSTQNRVWYSHDDGKTWSHLEIPEIWGKTDKLTLVGNDVYLNSGYLLRSSDFGNTWDTLSANIGYTVSFTGGSGVFLVGDGASVFRWDETSQKLIESINGSDKGCISDLSYGVNLIWTGTGNGLYAYDVVNESWLERMNLPHYGYGLVSANENGWVVASTYGEDFFYLSVDHGLSWDTIHTGLYFTELQLVGNNIFITNHYAVYRSTDKGLSWKPINFFFKSGDFVPFRNKHLVAGRNRLYETSDNGLTFQRLDIPIDIARLSSFENELFGLATDSLGIVNLYISDDAVNWIHAGEGLPFLYNNFLSYSKSFFFRDADHYYFFLDPNTLQWGVQPVYWSPVDEISWSPFPSAPSGSNWLFHDNILYLGAAGLYASEIANPFITSTRELSKTPKNLFSITPNPAKEFITIQFENNFTKKDMINIFSMDGVQVEAMELDGFDRELNISIAGLSEGVYYVQLKGDKVVDVKSFVKTN